MPTQKRIYALPQATTQSTKPAGLTGERLEKQHEEAVRQSIIEGCREMADVFLEIEREFQPLDAEVSRAYFPA